MRRVFLCERYQKNWRIVKSFTAETLLTFRIGEKIEELVREMIRGEKGECMVLKAGKFKIVGSPDIIFTHNNVKYIIENKSIKKDNFILLNEPLPAHRFQLSFYLWMATTFFNNFSDIGYLVYIPKEQTKPVLKIFEVRIDSKQRKIFDRFVKMFVMYTKEGRLPKPRCSSINHKCIVAEECFSQIKSL